MSNDRQDHGQALSGAELARSLFRRARALLSVPGLDSLVGLDALESVDPDDRQLLDALTGPHTESDRQAVLGRCEELLQQVTMLQPDYLPAAILHAETLGRGQRAERCEVIRAWERVVSLMSGAAPGSPQYVQLREEIDERCPPERVTTTERPEQHIYLAFEHLGKLYQEERCYEKALSTYERAVTCGVPDKWCLSAFWGLVECYWRMGEVERGIQALAQACTHYESAKEPLANLRHRQAVGQVYHPRPRRKRPLRSAEDEDRATLAFTTISSRLPEVQRQAHQHRWENVLACLAELADAFPGNASITALRADAYWAMGRYADAVNAYQQCGLSNLICNQILNCSVDGGFPLTGEELLVQARHQLFSYTRFTMANWGKVAARCQSYLDEFQVSHGEEFLAYFARKYRHERRYGNQSLLYREGLDYCFYAIPEFSETVRTAVTDCENAVRAQMGVAAIGEGWVSEATLYHCVKSLLPDYEVQHQARPEWIGAQHLDIYIPALKVAIEYQGEQHFEAIGLFGGEEGLQRTQERDTRKRQKCAEHGVRLLLVTPQDGVGEESVQRLLRDVLGHGERPDGRH
jgi:tetratricopeptide (TPR) repeat protein